MVVRNDEYGIEREDSFEEFEEVKQQPRPVHSQQISKDIQLDDLLNFDPYHQQIEDNMDNEELEESLVKAGLKPKE